MSEDAQFEAFWKFFPRRIGKKAAHQAWKRMTKEERETAVEMAEAFGEAMQDVFPANRCFIPHPSTWLNQGRWDDDPAEWIATAQTLERPRR